MSEVQGIVDAADQSDAPEIAKFKAMMTPEQRQAIERRVSKLRNYSPRVGVFGKTGAGKSSLCNALFGGEQSAVSHNASCTRKLVEVTLTEENGNQIILLDAPGIGEDGTHDEYVEQYRSELPKLDLVFWVIAMRDRALAQDVAFYNEHIHGKAGMPPVLFVVNQVDIAEPQGWDEKHHTPSPAQRHTIDARLALISDKFKVPIERVIGVSATKGYGLSPLVNRVVDILPKEKKLAFVDKVASAQVSPEARARAEKGFFDSVMDATKSILKTVGENKETIAWILSGVAWLIKTVKK